MHNRFCVDGGGLDRGWQVNRLRRAGFTRNLRKAKGLHVVLCLMFRNKEHVHAAIIGPDEHHPISHASQLKGRLVPCAAAWPRARRNGKIVHQCGCGKPAAGSGDKPDACGILSNYLAYRHCSS